MSPRCGELPTSQRCWVKDRETAGLMETIGLQTQELAELKIDNQSKNDEVLEVKKELEIVKQQEIATGMLQKEWAHADDTAKSSPGR